MNSLALLTTFPGWPEVTDPSPWHYFMLLLGGPALVCLLIAAIGIGLAACGQHVADERAAGLLVDGDHAHLDELAQHPAHAVASGEHGADAVVTGPLRRALPEDTDAAQH